MDISRSAQGRVATAQDRAGFPGWTAHLDTLLLHPDDGTTPVPLSLAEAALLRAFLQNANRLMTRAELQNDPGIRPGSRCGLGLTRGTAPDYSAAMLSAFSTRTAENLNSGIFPNGSIAGFVRIFAAAST